MPTYGVLDPYYKHKQLDRFGEAMGSIVAAFTAKKRAREAEADAETRRWLDLAMRDPEAATAMGDQMVERHGDRLPWVSSLNDVFKARGEEASRVRAAGREWLGSAGEIDEQIAAIHQQVAALPDTVQMPGVVAGGAMPNPVKAQTMEMLGQYTPAHARLLAADTLDPETQAYAQAYAYGERMPFPDVDPLTREELIRGSTPKVKSVLGTAPGTEAGRAARIGAGMELSAGQVQHQGLKERDQELKEVDQEFAKERLSGQAEAREIARLRVGIAERREAREEGEEGEAEKSLTTAAMASAMVADSKTDTKELTKDREASSRRRKHGHPTPEPLLRSQALRLAQKVKSATDDPAQQAAAIESLLRRYSSFLASGLSRSDAFRHVLAGTTPSEVSYRPKGGKE